MAATEFASDPLGFLDEKVSARQKLFWLPGRQLCVADAILAREILWNRNGNYLEHSDFFSSRAGTLSPRSLQISMAADARSALEAAFSGAAVASAVGALPVRSEWPLQGSKLLRQIFGASLLSGSRNRSLRLVIERVIAARIYSTKTALSPLTSPIYRWALRHSVKEFVTQLEKSGRGDPSLDVLEIATNHLGDREPIERRVQAFVSFLFAAIGSVGFSLSWTIYLMALHDKQDGDPNHLLSESLRMFPVAWLTMRKPSVSHMVGDQLVTPEDEVLVAPYAIHRHPEYWERPTEFDPSRWVNSSERVAWLPFGAGPHSCIGVNLTFRCVTALLKAIRERGRLRIVQTGAGPNVGPALRPPSFELHIDRVAQ